MNNLSPPKNQFTVLILQIVLALFIIQILRALIMDGLWYLLQPGENLVLFQIINGISFLVVGALLLVCFRPSLKDLSLDYDDIRKKTRIIYIGLGAILFILLTLPVILGFELELMVLNLVFGLIVPAFEELLFRGYLWNKVEDSLESQKDFSQRSGLITWITITLLFALWHMGYLDVFLIHPKQMTLAPILLSKIGIGLVLGLIVGFIRLKTGKVYGSFFCHAFWNIFAP